MKLYLITTDHMETKVWFREEADYVAGMNYVAVAVGSTRVMIVAFILMSNHVHFLIVGTYQDALRFICLFKQIYGTYYCKKYGVSRFFRGNAVDIREIPFLGETPEKAIAYVQMNSVAARICLEASGYRWGSGTCFFNDVHMPGRALGDMSVRKQRRLLKSHTVLPKSWKVCEYGYVLPESYVSIDYVEQLYGTPSRMRYFLLNSSKARMSAERNLPAFQDTVVQAAAKDLCTSMFHKNSISALSEEEKTELIKQLSRRFSTEIHQLCRTTGISYTDISNMLEAF